MRLKNYVKLAMLVSCILVSKAGNTQRLEKSLLWKVYGNGIKDTSFIYGTIHMIEKKDFVLSDRVKNSFEKSNSIVMEIDIDMDKETKRRLGRQAIFGNGKTMKSYLTEDEYTYFQVYLKDTLKINSIKLKMYEMFKPFFFQSAIMMEQMTNMESYEQTFSKMGKNKESLALETIDEQMAILVKDSVEVQVKEFMKDLKKGKLDASKEMKKMVDFYKNQDLQGLYLFMIESFQDDRTMEESNELKNRMLDQRNKHWIPKLENWMKQKTLFVAVGAGHLAGENGVLQLLKNQGYIVEPVIN